MGCCFSRSHDLMETKYKEDINKTEINIDWGSNDIYDIYDDGSDIFCV